MIEGVRNSLFMCIQTDFIVTWQTSSQTTFYIPALVPYLLFPQLSEPRPMLPSFIILHERLLLEDVCSHALAAITKPYRLGGSQIWNLDV